MKKCGLLAILFGMAAMSFGLFSSCDIGIGLGAAVDTEPPTLEITNPPTSAIIRDTFVITGTWKDDGSIKDVIVDLRNTSDSSSEIYSFTGKLEEDNKWSATIDPFNPKKIPDGKYEATITMTDNGGHNTISTRAFVIDNTAPVVILSRPASDASETDSNKIESYGQYLTLEGQASDDNNIEKIIVEFYNVDDPDTVRATKVIDSIPPTISLDVAKFLDNDVYTKIYGNDKSTGEKSYTCTITAYDGAKRYPTAGNEKADDEYGNGEASYILWADWEKFQNNYQKATGLTSKIKVPDLYALKTGKTIASAERSAETNSIIEEFFNKKVTRASFKLNPLNNPSYSISGLDLGVVSEVENERSLTIQLAKGLDGLSLDTDNMKVYLIPLDENGNEVSDTKLYPQKSDFQLKGDGQFLTAIQKDNVKDAAGNVTNLVYGTKYVIGVEGTDSEGNTIVPSFDGSKFLIRFKAKSVAPRLTVDSPSEPTTYIKKGEALLFKGTTAVPDGYPTISITCKKGEEDSATIYTYKVTEADKKGIEDGYIYYNWAFTVPAAGTEGQFFFDQTKSYIYEFDIAADLENMPNNRSKTVFYDVENPTIKIDSMLPTAEKYTGAEDGTKLEGSYLNGDVTMQVAISDDDAVNKEIKDQNDDKRPYFIIQDANTGDDISFRVGTETEPTKKHYITIPQKQSFVIHTEDIASTVQARKIKVKIFAQDRAGNFAVDFDDRTKTYFEREYTVDQSTDIPVILPYNSGSLTLTYSTKEELENHLAAKEYKSVLTTGSDLLLNLKDDDGIQKVLFYIGSKDTAIAENATPVINQTPQGSPSATTLQYTLPTISGRYQCKIQVEDTVGKKAEKAFWIIVTGAAPQVTISNTTPDNKIITLSTGAKTTDAKTQFVNNISIESGYNEFTVKRIEKVNNVDVETVLYGPNGTKGTILNGTSFEDTFIPAANRNENKIKYVVTDEMNHFGEREFIYYTDSAAPVIVADSIEVPSNTQTQNDSFRFVANSNDPSEGEINAGFKKSDVSKIQYTFDSAKGHIKTVPGTSLNEMVSFNDSDFAYVFGSEAGEGEKTIYIRAIDDVGNVGPWTEKSFMFDKADPAVNIVSYKRDTVDADFVTLPSASEKTFQSGKSFALKGTASDGNGLSSFEIWQKNSEVTYTDSADGKTKAALGLKLNISKDDISQEESNKDEWIISGLPKNANGESALASGTYTYTVIATDNSAFGTGENTQSAKTTSKTVVVSIDIEKPRVKIGFANGDDLTSADSTLDSSIYGIGSISGTAPYTFYGQAADDTLSSATGVRELFYAFTQTETAPTSESAYTSYGNPSGGNWNIPMNLGTGKNNGDEIVNNENGSPATLYEGQKYLWVYVYDNAGNKSGVKGVGFMVDQTAPSLIETKVHKLTGTGENISESSTPETADGNTVYLNALTSATGYTLRGKVSDANGISRVTVDGTTATLSTSANSDGSYNWSWTNSNQQGDYIHEIVVYDKSGKNSADGRSNTTTIHVIFDTTPPTTTNVNLDTASALATNNTWFKGTGDNYITGTASDVGSGLKKIEIKPDNKTEWSTLTLQDNWTYKFTIDDTLSENDYTNESFHTVEVRVTDKANNVTTTPYYFRYDKTLPFAELSLNKNDQYVNKNDLANITFSGYAHDGNTIGRAVGSAEIKVKKDNVDQSNLTMNVGPDSTDANYNGTAGENFGKFSKTGLNASSYADGTYTFTLDVKDKAGNTPSATSTLSQTMIVDKTPPSITEKGLVVGNDAAVTSISTKNPKATIQVTFTEKNIDSVYYYVDDLSVANRITVDITEDDEEIVTESTSIADEWVSMNRASNTGDSYTYTKAHQFSDGKGKVYLKIVDKAGNVAYDTISLSYEVDTKAPDVCTLGTVSVEGTELTGTRLINGTKPVVFTVTATDYNDNHDRTTENDPAKVASVAVKVGGGVKSTGGTINVEGPSSDGLWKITIPANRLNSGAVAVTVTDLKGNSKDFNSLFTLDLDDKAPSLGNYSLANSYDATAANETSKTFYMNNEKNGFRLEGIAKDDRVTDGDNNGEIEKVELILKDGTTTKQTLTSTASAWTFTIANAQWKNWTGDVTGTIKITDKAKNVTTINDAFTIKFDNEAPKAVHWADFSNKDIYFRIGNADNDKNDAGNQWETGVAVDATNNPKNEDVGSKYSFGSWGNDSTIQIRGTFFENGSGLKTINYAIFKSDPTSDSTKITVGTKQLTLKEAFVQGKLTSKSQSNEINAIGTFAPLDTPELRTVPYSTSATGRDKKDVKSNFRASLAGFNGSDNYLVLVAEDYVGNREADSLKNSTVTETNGVITKVEEGATTWNSSMGYYKILKDTTAPGITASVKEGAYTNGTGDIKIEATATDDDSGVRSVTVKVIDNDNKIVKINQKEEVKAELDETSGKYKATIPASTFASGTFTVYAKATDKAGAGNSKEVSAGTITVDTEPPTFDTDSIKLTETIGSADPKTAYKSGDTYYVNHKTAGKTFNIKGRAEDDFGVKNVSITVEEKLPANSTATAETLSIDPKPTNGAFDFAIPTANWSSWSDGATITLKVTDNAGNEVATPNKMNIVFDTAVPTVVPEKIVTPNTTETQSSLFTFKGNEGSIADETGASGPKKIDILFTSSSTTPANTTAAQLTGIEVSSTGVWTSTVEFGDSKFEDVFWKTDNNKRVDIEGEKYLWIKTYDNAGNAATNWTQAKSFVYDKAVPTISFTATVAATDTSVAINPAANSYNNNSFTLQVEASDGYGLKSVDILGSVRWTTEPANWSTIHTKYYKDESCKSKAPVTFEPGTYYFEKIPLLTTNDKTGIYSNPFAKNALTDGIYNFKVVVTDKADKTNSVTRSFTVDTTAPTISEKKIDTPPAIPSTNWYKTNQLTISATVTDTHSGISLVQAYVDNATDNKTSLSKGTGDVWSGSISCGDDGTHTIHIIATDVAGNETTEAAYISVQIDTTAPLAPVFLGAGPSGSIASANDITSLLVNPTLKKPVIVYAALKDGGNANVVKTGIADTDAFMQKGKTGASAKVTDLTTIKAFTKAWTASTAYSEGNVVKNNDKLYMCKTTHTSETEFAGTNWTELIETEYEFWSYTIPSSTTDMVNGGINFTVKDAAGNTADYTLFQMTVDTRAPAVTADALSDADSEAEGKQINGKITISGIASDENGLSTTEKIKLYYTTTASEAAQTTPDVSKWTKIGETTPTSDNTWSFTNIDTSKLDGTNEIANETKVYFLVSVQDKAGNIGYSARDEKLIAIIDQDSDRPVIKFTNLKFDTKDTDHPAMSASNLVPHQQTDLYGSIADDDGITSVHYIMSAESDPTANDSGWQLLSIENGSFSLNFDAADGDAGDGDGTKKLYFKIVDTANNTFISSATDSLNLKTPKLKDNSATAVKYGYRSSATGYKQTVAYLKVDNHAPFEGSLQFTTKSASTDTPTAADWKSKSEISSMPFGGPNERKTFKIRIPAWDANDVQTVTMTLPGYDGDSTKEGENPITFTNTKTNASVSTSPKATWWISPEIDVSALETGNKNCSITVSDGVKTSSDDFVIAIDNTIPVISASNPSSSQYSSGNIIAYGETDLTYWKNTSTTDQPREFMYYALSLDDSTIPADDFEATSETTASIITKWKDENGEEITSENTPAGAKVTLAYKPYYTPIKGGSFNWYVYFDDGISTENDSHDVSFKQFLINSGVTTQEAIETTDQDNKFRTKVQAYLWIKAVDQVGNNSVIKHPILIDPQGDAPSVTIDYPEADGTTLGGKVTLRGTAKDEKGNNPGVESVWVQIISAKENGYISSNENQTLGKENTSTAASGLKFADTVTDTETEEGNHSYSHSYNVTYFKPTMKDVKQWINAKDSSNNAIYEVYTKITDATPTRVSTVGTGDAWADTANGSAYYIKAKFSGSAWSLDINKNAEFNPDAGKLNPIAYRVFAKDKDKNLSSYEQQLGVFDSDNPILGTLYLRQYSDNEHGSGTIIASRPYEDNMWINGTWWLYGTVTDSDEFSVLTVNEVNQTTNGQTGTINYKITTENEVDTFELEIVASDNASTAHTTRKTCVINYDKKDPELAPKVSTDYKISSTVQNSNGFYTFGSQVTENVESGKAQSGFDYLAFWFEREITGTGGKHVVFDVMRPKTTTNGVTANTSEVEWSDLATFTTESDAKGLKWKNISATRSSTDLGKLTIDSEDKNIHVGGICMIRGSIYFIASVEKNTTTNKWEIGINGQPEYTTAREDVYFAIANIVNNNVESADGNNKSAADGMYGYYSSISNDDGDHMLESVKEQGTAWTWQANINSQNMGDGDVKLHYVAFDKAGNFKEGIEECKVANNAPRLASVTVWSDFNDNDDRDEGEYETMYYQGKERKLSSGYVQRATALNPTDKVFVVSGNNKDFNDNGSAFMTVKDKTRFIPEIIGGNGDLYYSYKYGKSSAFVADAAKTKLLTAHVGEKIGVGADHGIDEDIDSNGYYKEDLNNSGYIEGRTDLWEGTGVDEDDQKFMEIPGKLDTETTDSYSLNALGNHSTTDPMWFEYTIYDSTLGCADWNTTTLTTTGRLSSTFRVALAIKYTDETNPVVKIRPFYWNSKSDNSVSWDSNGNAEGHIELESDLTDAIKGSGTGQLGMGDDPKVSGKIVIDGFAYDDMKLKELHVQMSNHKKLDTQQTASTYNGTWTTRNFEDGWGFRAEDVYCNGNGHLVHWWLTVDTAARTNVAALDQSVVVYAVDARGGKESVHNSTTAQTSLTSYKWRDVKDEPNALKKYYTDFYYATKVTDKTETETLVYKGPESYTWKAVKTETNATSTYYTDFYCQTLATDATTDDTTVYKDTTLAYRYCMDIVPYITKVTTGLSSLKNAKQDSIYSRTSLGHYPVSVKNTGTNGADALTNTITISGFNLGNTTTVSLASISTAAATKGYYDHKVNNIPALNNYNKNDASGTSCVTLSNADVDYEKINKYGYNRMPNNSNNNKLTDDVIFDVWKINSDAARTYEGNTALREPVVRVNPTNGVVGMAFGNGSSRFSMPNKAGNNRGTSYELWQYNYATYVNIALCYDEKGVAHGISTGIDTYVTNTAQKAGRMSYFKSAWGPSKLDNVDGNFEGGNAIRFDCIGIPRRTETAFGVTTGTDPLLEEYRFYSPSIVATQKGTNGNNRANPTVYYAYYDKLSQQIRFRAGDIGGTAGTYGQFFQASANGEPAFIDNHYSVISGTSKYSNKDDMYNGGKYLGIDVIPGTSHNDDVVVAVWQDAITDALIFAYNDAPYAKVEKEWNTDEEDSGWKGYTPVKANAGFYCKVKCDSNGNVHIASVNDQDEVCYTYIPYTASSKTFGTPVTVTIDTFESGVKKVAIDVDKNNLPYITYFGTKGQPKMAYLPSMPATKSETTLKGCDTNGFTGVWEVGFIPTSSKLADDDARNQTSVWAPKNLTGTAAETNFYGTGGKEKAAGITLSNTTSPLVGYGVSPDGTSGRIELAQKW